MTQPGDSQARTRVGEVWVLDEVRFHHRELTVQSLWRWEREGGEEYEQHRERERVRGRYEIKGREKKLNRRRGRENTHTDYEEKDVSVL